MKGTASDPPLLVCLYKGLERRLSNPEGLLIKSRVTRIEADAATCRPRLPTDIKSVVPGIEYS